MKTRMLRRQGALLLVVLMIASLAASAPAESKYFNETGLPICDTPIHITVVGDASSCSNTPDPQKTDMIAFLADEMGIEITYTLYAADAWKTQYNLMKATNTLPDLIAPGSAGDWAAVSQDGADGYLMAWNDYLEYMPNLSRNLAEYEDYRNSMTSADGNIYALGRYTETLMSSSLIGTFWIRGSWLENLNLEKPTTVDELYEVLKAFKEQDADMDGDPDNEIPLGYIPDWTGRYMEMILLAAFGCYTHSSPYLYADESGTVGTYATTDGYKEYLKYMNKLYTEGLIEKEAFTMGSGPFNENKAAMRYGAVSHTSYFSANLGIYDSIMVTGLTSDICDTVAIAKRPATSTPQICMSATTEYPEAIARMVDYYLDRDHIHEFNSGMEGVHFDWVEQDINGILTLWNKDYSAYMAQTDYETQNDFIFKKAVVHNMFQLGFEDTRSYYSSFDALSLDQLQQYLDYVAEHGKEENLNNAMAGIIYGVKSLGDYKVVDIYPNLAYRPDEITQLSTLKTDLTNFITASQAEFIIGTRDIETGWDTYINEIKGMGLDTILSIEQAAYDRYNQ